MISTRKVMIQRLDRPDVGRTRTLSKPSCSALPNFGCSIGDGNLELGLAGFAEANCAVMTHFGLVMMESCCKISFRSMQGLICPDASATAARDAAP